MVFPIQKCAKLAETKPCSVENLNGSPIVFVERTFLRALLVEETIFLVVWLTINGIVGYGLQSFRVSIKQMRLVDHSLTENTVSYSNC